jgi:hypothetical protein
MSLLSPTWLSSRVSKARIFVFWSKKKLSTLLVCCVQSGLHGLDPKQLRAKRQEEIPMWRWICQKIGKIPYHDDPWVAFEDPIYSGPSTADSLTL